MPVTTHLRGLQALELTLRTGSIKAAADELAITPAACGQRIKALETYLGYELIQRGRSGVRPTNEVRPAVAHLAAAFRELDTVTRLLDFQRVTEIHITADSDWAQLWLSTRLAHYKAEHPNTLFCINGVGDVPLRLGGADCEVRFSTENTDGDVLYRDYLLPISSPTNRDRIAAYPNDEMLEGFPLLHISGYDIDAADMGWPEWISRFGHRRTDPERGIRYQTVVRALEAVYADAGLVICGLSLVMPQIQEGALTVPFPLREGAAARGAYRARFTPESLSRGVVQQFREWLLQEAAKTQDELATMGAVKNA